jgi:hypothetical protein
MRNAQLLFRMFCARSKGLEKAANSKYEAKTVKRWHCDTRMDIRDCVNQCINVAAIAPMGLTTRKAQREKEKYSQYKTNRLLVQISFVSVP